jgi:HTH-type transcriptional regulator / antitoxin HigA
MNNELSPGLDYQQATCLLHRLLDIVRDDAKHPLYPQIEFLGDMLEVYEEHLEPHDS